MFGEFELNFNNFESGNAENREDVFIPTYDEHIYVKQYESNDSDDMFYNNYTIKVEEDTIPRVTGGKVGKCRPGRKAKLSDSQLKPEELRRRQVRRERNRVAARKCRERRINNTCTLEAQVNTLQNEKMELQEQNDFMKKQIKQLEAQLRGRENVTEEHVVQIVKTPKEFTTAFNFWNPSTTTNGILTPNLAAIPTPLLGIKFDFSSSIPPMEYNNISHVMTKDNKVLTSL